MKIKAIIASFSGLIGILIGEQFERSMWCLFILCILDFIFAMINAHVNGKIRGRKFNSTFAPKKALDFFAYFTLAVVMKLLTETSVSHIFGNYLIEATIVWFAVGEVISLLEHAACLGYRVPISFLKDLDKRRDLLDKRK